MTIKEFQKGYSILVKYSKHQIRPQEIPLSVFLNLESKSHTITGHSFEKKNNSIKLLSKYQHLFYNLSQNFFLNFTIPSTKKKKSKQLLIESLLIRYSYKIKLFKIIIKLLMQFFSQKLETKAFLHNLILSEILKPVVILPSNIMLKIKRFYNSVLRVIRYTIRTITSRLAKKLKTRFKKTKKLIQKEILLLKTEKKFNFRIKQVLLSSKTYDLKKPTTKKKRQELFEILKDSFKISNNEKTMPFLNYKKKIKNLLIHEKYREKKWPQHFFSSLKKFKNYISKHNLSSWYDFLLLQEFNAKNLILLFITPSQKLKFLINGKRSNDILIKPTDILTIQKPIELYIKIFFII